MEVCSVLLCNGYTPWQGLLFTASLLTCWHLSTTTQPTIESVPPQVAEGENVLFLVHKLPKNAVTFVWSKEVNSTKLGIAMYALNRDLSAPGPMYSNRETVYRNGSLLLRNVRKTDTGIYTLQILNHHSAIVSTTTMFLHVHTFLWTCGRHDSSGQPTIESVPPRIAEGGSVLLIVRNPPENIISYVWYKWLSKFKKLEVVKYRRDTNSVVWGSAYSGRETLYTDGSLLLHGITQKDPGLYTLRITRADMGFEEADVKLYVDSSLSLSCSHLCSSQINIQAVPQYAAEGEAVRLQVHNLPEDLRFFSWYSSNSRTRLFKIKNDKALKSVSRGNKHRVKMTVYNNGSMMFPGVTEEEAGMYILEALKKDSKIEKAYVEFYVKKNVKQPFVKITDIRVAGRRSVIFSCISPDTNISIRWLFNNQALKLTERMTLSPTKCGLRIDPVRSEDAGEYKCEVSNRFSLKSSLPVSWP